ncbi:hypothetical protein Tco_1297620 [Tanacetum coccineum]
MLGMVVDMQEGRLLIKESLLKVGMFIRRLGMEMCREVYELKLLQEMLLMFSAITTMPKNYFLLMDASKIEELEVLSANICMMARIQQSDNGSKNGPSYDSALISGKVYKAGKRLLYVKRNKAISLGIVTSRVGIEVQQLSLKDCTWLPKKWLSFCQSLRHTNHVKDFELASLFGKLKYEENLIDIIYETKKKKSLVSATPLSIAFLSTFIVQDFHDSPDDEEDTRSNQEYLTDLKEKYQAIALLAKSKRFFKKGYSKVQQCKSN